MAVIFPHQPTSAWASLRRFLTSAVFQTWPFIYAPVVTVYTTAFLARVAPPPVSNLTLLGELTQVAAYYLALPLLAIFIEWVSFRSVAIAWRRRGQLVGYLFFVLSVGMQLVPALAVYTDARVQEYVSERDAALAEVRINDERAAAAYARQLVTWDAAKKDISYQLADVREKLSFASTQLAATFEHLRDPITIVERQRGNDAAVIFTTTVQDLETADSELRHQLVEVAAKRPSAPAPSEASNPVLRQSWIDYVMQSASTPNAVFALIVALFLTTTTLVAGLAAAADDEEFHAVAAATPTPVAVDIAAHLAICRQLPPERQPILAGQIAATIRAQVVAADGLQRLAGAIAAMQWEAQRQEAALRLAASLRADVIGSGLAGRARARLEREIDALVATATTAEAA